MAQLLGEQYFVARDRNGQPIEGAKAYFFLTGTSTSANVYADGDLDTPLEQPVLSDSAGRFDAIYLDPSVEYKMRVYDENDVEVEPSPYDPLTNFADFFDPDAAPASLPWVVPISDDITPITTGTAKRTWRMPSIAGYVLTAIRASLKTAQATGSIVTVDVNVGGVSILSTKLTIDNTETTSVSAAIQPVISTPNIADNAELTFDIDQVGDGTAIGLTVEMLGHEA